MEFIVALWLPILASAAAVWVASAVVWMFLPHHKSDWKGAKDEDALREAIRAHGGEPGQIVVPHCKTAADWKSPELRRKYEDGPVAYLCLLPSGVPTMGGKMLAMFVLNVVVSMICAYVAHLVLADGEAFKTVFRVIGPIAWLAYSAAHVQGAVWFGRSKTQAFKEILDGLAYALITAAVFGALWPQAA